MKKPVKTLILFAIPILFAFAIGFYFGYGHYFYELKNGSDDVDAFRWASIAGLFYSPTGLIIGLIFDLFIWMIITPPKHLRQNV